MYLSDSGLKSAGTGRMRRWCCWSPFAEKEDLLPGVAPSGYGFQKGFVPDGETVNRAKIGTAIAIRDAVEIAISRLIERTVWVVFESVHSRVKAASE